VLRCGGGRALTKRVDEVAVKAQLGLEDANKVVASTVELVCDEALVLCGGRVKPVREIAPVKVRVNAVRSKAGKAVHELYDLEQSGAAEKKLNLDLDLYQMENY
jgi:hypothetical protein